VTLVNSTEEISEDEENLSSDNVDLSTWNSYVKFDSEGSWNYIEVTVTPSKQLDKMRDYAYFYQNGWTVIDKTSETSESITYAGYVDVVAGEFYLYFYFSNNGNNRTGTVKVTLTNK
jgi:restriction endonuclease S subunit